MAHLGQMCNENTIVRAEQSVMAATKFLLLDSAARTQITDNTDNYEIELNLDTKGFSTLYLAAARVPHTIPTVNARNNTIVITGSVAGAVTVTLTQGFYDVDSLATEFETQLGTGFSGTISVTYSDVTNKLTIDSDTETLTVAADANVFACRLLGIAPGVAATLVLSSTSNEQANQMDLSFPRYLQCHIYDVRATPSHYDSYGSATFVVPITGVFGEFGDIVEYINNEPYVQQCSIPFKQIKHIRIQWEWPDHQPLNGAFGGVDNQIILGLV